MKGHMTLEAKEAIVRQALVSTDKSLSRIAAENNIGHSTLYKWLKTKQAGGSLSKRQASSSNQALSSQSQLKHLLATSNLDASSVNVYCREQGIYRHQLSEWEERMMSTSKDKSQVKQLQTLRVLKLENKALKKELYRKDKALAESAALLILKKKADLIWGGHEDD